jgi:hypothetical protein
VVDYQKYLGMGEVMNIRLSLFAAKVAQMPMFCKEDRCDLLGCLLPLTEVQGLQDGR